MQRINKKIRNATPRDYEGIHFKSELERSVYKRLLKKISIYYIIYVHERKEENIAKGNK